MIALTRSGQLRATTPEAVANPIALGAEVGVEHDQPRILFRAGAIEPLRRANRAEKRSPGALAADGLAGGAVMATGAAGISDRSSPSMPSSATSAFSLREVALPPGTQRLRLVSAPDAIASA